MSAFKILIKLLRGIVSFAAAIVAMFFINHIFGFLFGFGFKSLGGKVTPDILGAEIGGIIILGGIYWMLDKLYNRI